MKAGNMKATLSFLKLALPAALVLLLAGCITDPYQYRGDGYGGDYYYGRPSVEYRHHGYYGGYGYPSYGRSGWSFGIQYGHPYGYGRYGGYSRYGYGRHGYGYGGYGGWPYYYRGWPSYPPIVVYPHPHPDPQPGSDSDQGPAPWRDLDRIRDGGGVGIPVQDVPNIPRNRAGQPPLATRPEVTRPPAPRPSMERAPRQTSDSRVERAQRILRDRDEP